MDYQPIKYLYYDKKTNKKNPAVKQGFKNNLCSNKHFRFKEVNKSLIHVTS